MIWGTLSIPQEWLRLQGCRGEIAPEPEREGALHLLVAYRAAGYARRGSSHAKRSLVARSPATESAAGSLTLGGLGPRAWAGAVFAASLALRLVFLFDIRANPFFRVPVIDAEYYHQQALLLVSGTPLPLAPFQMPPLYPFVLSLVYRLFGPDLVAAHLLQVVLGAATAMLTFLLAHRVAQTRLEPRPALAAALVAAAFTATSKALLFLEADLLATPLAVCLDLLAVWLFVRAVDSPRLAWPNLVASGLVLGLAALCVPTVLVCVPFWAVWLAWRRRAPRAALAFVALVALPILPVTWRNHQVSGEWVSISANGGINAWMSNNPDWQRTSALRPGPEWRAMQELPLRTAGIVQSSERDRWFGRQAFEWWLKSPLQAIAGTARKTMLLVHDHEIMRDFDFYYFKDHFSALLRLPGWSFSWLFTLAIVGMVGARRVTPLIDVPAIRALDLFLLGYALGIVVFLAAARYRAPLLPLLAVWAGMGVVWIGRQVRSRSWRALSRPAAVAAIALLVSELDVFGVDRVDVAEAEYRIATTFEKQGRLPEAIARYDANLQRDPDHALSAARAALCAQQMGRTQEAVDRYETLLERHPDYAEAAVNLANLAWQGGARDAAAHYFEVALHADPYLAQAHASQGRFLRAGGDAPGAVRALTEALRLDPTWQLLRIDLAAALLAAGDRNGAQRELDRALAIIRPAPPELWLVQGDFLAADGRAAAAQAAWRQGAALQGGNPATQEELARRLAAAISPGGH